MTQIHKYLFNSRLYSLIFAICAVVLFSCEGEDGAQGPKGDTGAQGPQGPQGPEGPKGDNGAPAIGYARKSGYIEGTVAGKFADETSYNNTFKYEYTWDYDIIYGDYLELYRQESGFSNASNIYFEFYLNKDENGNWQISWSYFDLEIWAEKTAVNVEKIEYSRCCGSAVGEYIQVSNFIYNEETGAMSFDFTIQDESGWNNQPLTVNGKFSSGEGKVYRSADTNGGGGE